MRALCIVLILSAWLTGCAGTGLGRAWDQAWNGTPPEVVDAVQFMDRTMSKELREKYAAIEAADVTDPKTGLANREWAENRFRDLEATQAQIRRWKALSGALAAYLGVTLEEPIDFSTRQADLRREEFWKAIEDAARALKKETP